VQQPQNRTSSENVALRVRDPFSSKMKYESAETGSVTCAIASTEISIEGDLFVAFLGTIRVMQLDCIRHLERSLSSH
jgi:hypothetical protein